MKNFKKFKLANYVIHFLLAQLLILVTCCNNKVPVAIKLSCLRGW